MTELGPSLCACGNYKVRYAVMCFDCEYAKIGTQEVIPQPTESFDWIKEAFDALCKSSRGTVK